MIYQEKWGFYGDDYGIWTWHDMIQNLWDLPMGFTHDLPNKHGDFMVMIMGFEPGMIWFKISGISMGFTHDLPNKHGDLPNKNGDFMGFYGISMVILWDWPMKKGDLPKKNGDLPMIYPTKVWGFYGFYGDDYGISMGFYGISMVMGFYGDFGDLNLAWYDSKSMGFLWDWPINSMVIYPGFQWNPLVIEHSHGSHGPFTDIFNGIEYGSHQAEWW